MAEQSEHHCTALCSAGRVLVGVQRKASSSGSVVQGRILETAAWSLVGGMNSHHTVVPEVHRKNAPILTSRCQHEASRSITDTVGTSVASLNKIRKHFEALHSWDHSWDCKEMYTMLLTGWFGLPRDVDVTSPGCVLTELTMHSAARHFYLALPVRPFNVGRECKIYLSACRRYIINCGIQAIQNTHIHRAEIGKLFDWPRLLCFSSTCA